MISGKVDYVEFMSDGNAFAIIGKTKRALRDAGNSREDIENYIVQMMGGDYDNVLSMALAVLEFEDE